MSYPILYTSTETAFATNGVGILSDAISCTVTEERNGSYELQMQYPMDGLHFAGLVQRALITARPNQTANAQPFRIYRITKPLNGVVTVYAQHISYDLTGVVVDPFTAASAPAAMVALQSGAVNTNPFTFWTDKTTAATMKVDVPSSVRALLGGVEGSVLDTYGGEYEFDRYTVRLYGQRGLDRGVTIRYGKNLLSLEQEENCSGVYTGVYPYWANAESGELVRLPEKIVPAEGTYDFSRILPLDFSAEWQEAPTEEQLRSRAQTYIKSNSIGVPSVSLTVSFAQLEQTEEYKGMALLERVSLCDTVHVEFARLGVSATAKAITITYNVLLDRIESVELGDARASLAQTIVDQQKEIAQAPDKTFLQQAVENATAQITGNLGGYVVMHSSTGGKEPDEILVMDTPDITTATKVWRWNKSGLGYSGTGYNGPYGLAMTQDGQIVANYVATGTLNASIIGAGILQSLDEETFYLDLVGGVLKMKATSLSIEGQSVNEIAADAAADAVDAQTQTDIFNKLTNNGQLQGLYMEGGKLYINATYMKTGTVTGTGGYSYWNLETGAFRSGTSSSTRIEITPGTINQYYQNYLTGVFHSAIGKTYIGCNSQYTFLGWFSSGTPSFNYSSGGKTDSFVGITIEQVAGLIHCNATKFEIPGRIECSSLAVNGREI